MGDDGGALAALPDAQLEAITLAYYGGLTHTEIADRLGLPCGTVKGPIRLGMDKLRLAFEAPDLSEAALSPPDPVLPGGAPSCGPFSVREHRWLMIRRDRRAVSTEPSGGPRSRSAQPRIPTPEESVL